MPIRKDIENAIHDAMRNRDESKLRVLRLLLSAIKMADVEKGIPIDDATILSLVQKEIKIRLDSIKDAESAGRVQMIEQNQQEAKLLESYLPKQLSRIRVNKNRRRDHERSASTKPGRDGKSYESTYAESSRSGSQCAHKPDCKKIT